MAAALAISLPPSLKKEESIALLSERLRDPAAFAYALESLGGEDRQALEDLRNAGGVLAYQEFTRRHGIDAGDAENRRWRNPQTLLGRLRARGLVCLGTVGGQESVMIPREVRELLGKTAAPR